VFKIDPAGNENILHRFIGWETPNAVIVDQAGDIYGTTWQGGGLACYNSSCGVVFNIDTAGNFRVLHNFTGADGISPAGLIRDGSGNIFGTAGGGSFGYGNVFKIDAAGNFSVLHSFNGADGANPAAALVLDASGNLYGSASLPGPPYSWFVFRIDAAGSFTVVATFEGYAPGLLSLDVSGTLYGTGDQTVFKITPSAPFSSFTAKLDIPAGGFQLQAFFTQGAGAATINPVAQGMTLTLGTYTVTIPPGAFHQTKKGWFVYEGTIDGVALDIRLSHTGANSYELQAEGSGPHFTSLTKPITVTLALGNNSGTTVVDQ